MSYDVKTFIVIFDNSKKHKPHVPIQHYDAVGVEFQRTKHVVLDTHYAPRASFRNIDEMKEELGKWGKVELTWLVQEVPA